jgi:hypothetical protein
MKIIGLIIKGAVVRAFTKKNGSLVSTTMPDGQWDLEATLAWFIRALLMVALLYIAKELGVDPALVLANME